MNREEDKDIYYKFMQEIKVGFENKVPLFQSFLEELSKINKVTGFDFADEHYFYIDFEVSVENTVIEDICIDYEKVVVSYTSNVMGWEAYFDIVFAYADQMHCLYSPTKGSFSEFCCELYDYKSRGIQRLFDDIIEVSKAICYGEAIINYLPKQIKDAEKHRKLPHVSQIFLKSGRLIARSQLWKDKYKLSKKLIRKNFTKRIEKEIVFH